MFSWILKASYSRKDLKLIENKIVGQEACTPIEFYKSLAEVFYHLMQEAKSETPINGELDTGSKKLP